MMRRLATVLFLMLAASNVLAQTEQKAPEYGWNNTLIAGLNITQVSLQNWVQGGENALAWTLAANGKSLYTQESYVWTNSLKIMYGQTKIGTRQFEKTDDELFYESVLAYNVGWKVNPFFALTARTQIAPGYKMLKDANGVDVRTQTSAFFDPGYLMQSAGFTYAPSEEFATRLGVAVKESFASEYARFGYTGDPTKRTRVQTGVESGTSIKVPIMENMMYPSQLNMFSAFDKLDVWDVRWDNSISAKVNSYVNVSLNVLIVHEIAQSRRTQMKQVLALGLSYTLF